MKKIFLTLVLTLIAVNISLAQKIEKTFLNPADSTTNCYLTVYPSKLPWTGFLFLIPSFGEAPEMVLTQTDLPKVAAEKGLLVIIPTFSTGFLSFGVDSLTQQSFKEILADVTAKHKLIDLPFFVGGFSIGGSCTVKFAETALSENAKVKPKAIFAIDPPLDFERFYHSSLRMIRLGIQSQEAHYYDSKN